MIVKFPKYNEAWGVNSNLNPELQYHRYYNIHPDYICNLFKYSKTQIQFLDVNNFKFHNKVCIESYIDDKLVLFDFSDHTSLTYTLDQCSNYTAIFKFHYNELLHKDIKNMYTFSPVNFHNWDFYNDIKNAINYKADGLIINKQAPAGNAIARRNMVRELLIKTYKTKVDYAITNKELFFMAINNCLVSVCVPGARNDMLDRGQAQYMFLGACTISPRLITQLSYFTKLEPNVHYIECKPDYSDLIEKIEWCKLNAEKCIEIGNNARNVFLQTSTPEKQIEWIKKCINNE